MTGEVAPMKSQQYDILNKAWKWHQVTCHCEWEKISQATAIDEEQLMVAERDNPGFPFIGYPIPNGQP